MILLSGPAATYAAAHAALTRAGLPIEPDAEAHRNGLPDYSPEEREMLGDEAVELTWMAVAADDDRLDECQALAAERGWRVRMHWTHFDLPADPMALLEQRITDRILKELGRG